LDASRPATRTQSSRQSAERATLGTHKSPLQLDSNKDLREPNKLSSASYTPEKTATPNRAKFLARR
jgi:hypothetical protein